MSENFCVFLSNQKAERRRLFGTGLVRHCPQGLFKPFFAFLCAIFSRPFRLSLAPTICPWVSEDASRHAKQQKTNGTNRQLRRIGPLQLATHVVQNRRAGEQKSHWDKTNKENYHLKLCMSFVCLVLVRILLSSVAVLYHVNG